MEVHLLVVLACSVFCVAATGTWITLLLARRYGWLARAREDRWHKTPTALFGGVGFYPAFAMALIYFISVNLSTDSLAAVNPDVAEPLLLASLLTGSLVMFAFGWADDIKNYRPATKLVVQFVAVSPFILAGGVYDFTGFYPIDLLICYFWFFGITNSINLLDNMDGLATGVALISAVTIVVLAAHDAQVAPIAVPVGVAFAAMLLAFWLFNRPPAKIFMGDSGSLFIGFTLAALAFPSSLNNFYGIQDSEQVFSSIMALLIPVTVLAIPIFDTTFVTITRKLRARKASQGGRDHTSHRLVLTGLSDKQAVWSLYAFALFGGLMAVLMRRYPDASMPVFVVFALVLTYLGIYLGRVKVMDADGPNLPPVWVPIVNKILYKRRAAEVILDVILVVTSFYIAYLLRFDAVIPEVSMRAVEQSLPIVVASCLTAFILTGIYRGEWRWFSLNDLPRFITAISTGVMASLASVVLITRFYSGHSRSAFLIFGLVLFVVMVGSRLSFRLIDFFVQQRLRRAMQVEGKQILIYGAGKTGKLLQEATLVDPILRNYAVIGFIDDDTSISGRRLNNLPVRNKTQWRMRAPHVSQIWIASHLIKDTDAVEYADSFDHEIIVRRLAFSLKSIQPKDEEIKLSSTEMGIDSESLRDEFRGQTGREGAQSKSPTRFTGPGCDHSVTQHGSDLPHAG